MRYQASIDLSNKNNSHTLAYDLIEKHANGGLLRVLEVGCSGGYFGAAVRAQGHTVWGVEPDYKSSQIAKEELDFAFNGTLDDFYRQHKDEKFDVIVFGDVLEHFSNPASALVEVKAIMNDGGVIVASVPNVSHITVRAMLLEGRWEYNDLGIMDRTHLQFFTEETLVELFDLAGFNVEEIKKVRLSAKEAAQLVGLKVNNLFIKLIEETVIDPNLDVFQNIVLARLSSTKEKHVDVKNPANLSSDFQDLQKQNKQFKDQVASQNDSIERLNDQLLQMNSSTSWKLTAPLRYISSLFRK